MAYSRSLTTLQNRLHLLQPLMEGHAARWETVPQQAHQLAYQIREALFIARLPGNKERYPGLALAAEKFTIEVLDEERGIVQAVPTQATTEAARLTQSGTDGVLQSGAVAGPRTNQLAGIQTALSVVEHWMRAQPSNDKFYFPEAQLDEEQLTKLFLWARSRKLMLIVSGAALTLAPRDVHVASVAWHPEDWTEPEEETKEEPGFPTDQP